LLKERPIRRVANDWRRIWNPQTIVVAALLSVGVAFVMVDVLGKHLMAESRASLPATAIISHYVAPAFLLFTLSIVVGSVSGAFRRRDQKALLTTVIAAYFSLMLVFASIYYEMAFSGDLRDAVFKYEHYRADALRGVASPLYSDQRAFHGIERRFWSGLDWPLTAARDSTGLPAALPTASPAQMRDTAGRRPLNNVIQFIPEARLAIFGDCLHLSVITMTTVGYGDITPRQFGPRFATDAEAVCNTLLLIFGLGMIFGRWRATVNAQPVAKETPK
jgi:hypothetical protein